jgi:hypothetical protein
MRYVLYMFRDLSLTEVFERIADADEWREFCQLDIDGDVDTWIWIFSLRDASKPPCARERAVLRFRELQAKFVSLLREKLRSGEWAAFGFNPQFGPHPVQIDSKLWRVLEFAVTGEGAEGGDFKFTNLSFSALRCSSETRPHAERASLRRELVRWIEAVAARTAGPMTSSEVRELARVEFSGTTISDHLFADAWRAADKPANFRQKGRPKAKGMGI